MKTNWINFKAQVTEGTQRFKARFFSLLPDALQQKLSARKENRKRDLQHMSRQELVEIIYQQKQWETELQAQLAETRRQLADKNLRIERAGSLAEAALDVSGVLTAAQSAVEMYMESLKGANADIEAELADAKAERDRILAQARQEAQAIREESLARTEQEIEDAWQQAGGHPKHSEALHTSA